MSGALARKASRGGHAWEDHPNRDDVNFMRHTMAYEQGDGLAAGSRLAGTWHEPTDRKY